MKKRNWMKKGWFIPALCYGICLLIWLVSGLLLLGSDLIAAHSGSLYSFEAAAEGFTPVNMHEEDGRYVTENGDPQMLWQNFGAITLRTLRMRVDYTGSPREICLYYTEQEGEPFGVNKRVFAAQDNDGSYLFTLPAGRIEALRLDPCSPVDGNVVSMEFENFEFNEKIPFWKYFAPGWPGFFRMLVDPGLAAAALSIAADAVMWYKSKRKKAPHSEP